MGIDWRNRWLYPASSEPPPLDPPPVQVFVEDEYPMPRFPVWVPPHIDDTLDPIENPDVPFIQSSWTMVCTTWSVSAIACTVEVEEVAEFVVLPDHYPMPEFPTWRPPPEPSFYSTDAEFPHPEIDTIILPVWVPWRPTPHADFFTTDAEIITTDKFESPLQVPVWPLPHTPDLVPQQLEPIPDNEPYFDDAIPLPPQRPHFQPPHEPYFNDLPSPPPKCPPPCLRRPDRKC